MKFSKLIRVLHRDLGYLFFGASIIYAISGIALNHIRDFNPNFEIERFNVTLNETVSPEEVNEQWVKTLLLDLEQDKEYKKHYFPAPNVLKVFLYHGNMEVNLDTGKGLLETIRKRPVLYQVNFLHYNPGRWWKWFSDIFCVAWIIISITGLLLIKKGRYSLNGLGGIYTVIGIVVPLVLFLLYI